VFNPGKETEDRTALGEKQQKREEGKEREWAVAGDSCRREGRLEGKGAAAWRCYLKGRRKK